MLIVAVAWPDWRTIVPEDEALCLIDINRGKSDEDVLLGMDISLTSSESSFVNLKQLFILAEMRQAFGQVGPPMNSDRYTY
jgi:hypothetical protein